MTRRVFLSCVKILLCRVRYLISSLSAKFVICQVRYLISSLSAKFVIWQVRYLRNFRVAYLDRLRNKNASSSWIRSQRSQIEYCSQWARLFIQRDVIIYRRESPQAVICERSEIASLTRRIGISYHRDRKLDANDKHAFWNRPWFLRIFGVIGVTQI